MKNSFLRWTSSDSIRAEIQKEEINRIIQEQVQKKELKKKNVLQQITLLHKPQIKEESHRKMSSFSIRKTRSKQLSRCPEKSPESVNPGVNLDQQINYFSIKKRYQKVIDSSFDHQLVNELRHEMMTPLYSVRDNNTSNFFQKVFAKNTKLKKYFEGIKKDRMARMSVSVDLQFR